MPPLTPLLLLATSALAHPDPARLRQRAEREIARFDAVGLLDPATWDPRCPDGATPFVSAHAEGCVDPSGRATATWHLEGRWFERWLDGSKVATMVPESDGSAVITRSRRRVLLANDGHIAVVQRWTLGPIALGPVERTTLLAPDGHVERAFAYLVAPPAGPYGVRTFEDGLETRRGPEYAFDAAGRVTAITHWPGGHMTGAWLRSSADATESGRVRRGAPIGRWRCVTEATTTHHRYHNGTRSTPLSTGRSGTRTGARDVYWPLDLTDPRSPSPCADEAAIRAWTPDWAQ